MAVLLVLSATLPFARTLGHDLVWDDRYLVADVDALARGGGVAAVARAPFLPDQNEPDPYYRPVVLLSLWLDRHLGGGAAATYHATNLALHAVNTLLAALLLWRLLGSAAGAIAGAVLFAVHPVQVEAVSFVAARTDLWAAFFVLISTNAWFAACETAIPARRGAAVAATGIAYAAACLAKESAVVLPAVLAVWTALRVGDGRVVRHGGSGGPVGLGRAGAAFAAMAVALGVVAAARLAALGAVLATPVAGDVQGPLVVREPGLAIAAAVRMLGLLAWPWPLNSLYTREGLAPGVMSLVGVSLWAAAAAWLGRRRDGCAGWGGAVWTVSFLLPALLVPSGSATLAAERYLYVPSIGAAIIFGAAARRAAGCAAAARRVAAAAAACLLIGAGALSTARSLVWRSDLTLTADQVRTAPASAFAHDLRGQALLGERQWADALEEFRRAIAIDPDDPAYHNDLGIAWRRLERPDLAALAFRQALRLAPDFARARLNLAYACVSLRDGACIEEQRAALAALDATALSQLEAELARRGVRRGAP